MKICLYGAGSSRINEDYKKTGYQLGCKIANRGHSLIFGGGSTGMMGAVSKGVNDNNGRTVGIAPQWMDDFEGISDDCDRFIKTEAMEDRKRLFEEFSDAFIITPGGLGTLDEIFEIITLKKLHIHNKPIVIFNMNHFYDSMLEMIDFMIKENTIPEDNRNLFKVCYTIEETLDYIESHDESE